MSSLITIAISGCSSSGKTTLMYLLETLLPTSFTIQQDEFQVENLPLQPNGVPNAECPESIDMQAFEKAIRICQETGSKPADFTSWQDPKDIEAARQKAIESISETERQTYRQRLIAAIGPHRVGIVEGFLLYQEPELLACADVRLFLRTSKSAAKARRMARPGYENPDSKDFWRTESYFETAVWANYVKEHGFLFEGNDVEAMPNRAICELMGIIVQPTMDSTIQDTIRWAVDAICDLAEREA